jgi:hypothetical protein
MEAEEGKVSHATMLSIGNSDRGILCVMFRIGMAPMDRFYYFSVGEMKATE